MWDLRLDLDANTLGHLSQWNGFSPVCVRIWSLSSSCWEHCLEQMWHISRFSFRGGGGLTALGLPFFFLGLFFAVRFSFDLNLRGRSTLSTCGHFPSLWTAVAGVESSCITCWLPQSLSSAWVCSFVSNVSCDSDDRFWKWKTNLVNHFFSNHSFVYVCVCVCV